MTRAFLPKIFTVLLAGVLAGLALAAAALPAALVFGIGFSALAAPYAELPNTLRTPPTAQRSNLYANDGTTLITSFYQEDRVDVPLREVAPVMRQAIVAAEDARFHEHSGVDLRGIVRAFAVNRRDGATRQGASTLTMQYVRNVLSTDPRLTEAQRVAATEVSTARKIQEIRYALALERELTKDQIMARYLNIAYFGAGAYGVAAASKRYFSTSPAKLTLAQSALLAGLVRSPDSDDPINGDADSATERRAYVLDRMVESGQLTPDVAARARAEPLNLRPSETPNDCTAVPEGHNDWAFFCDWFTRWWNDQRAFGGSVDERQRTLRRGGFTIVSSLDPGVQRATTEQVRRIYSVEHPHALPTAVVQPGTGRVVAMSVNRVYSVAANPSGQQNHPNTVNQLVAGGGTIVGYQAGSTFKLFTMLAALEAGLPLRTVFDAPPRIVTDYRISGEASCGGYWCPQNASASASGVHDMWSAFGNSVNTYFAWLTERVGADRVVEMAERLGIVFRAEDDAQLARHGAREWGPFTLGVAATTPLDLAGAYATVAAEGTWCAPTPVTSITDADGRRVAAGAPDCRQVLDVDVARAAADAARCPVGDQSMYQGCAGGTASRLRGQLARPVAGKTGSSERYATETVVAFTPQLVVAAMAANPDEPRDAVGRAVQAVMVEGVGEILGFALRDEPVRDFVPPSETTAWRITGQRTGN
ncbi:Membrane carboxypeptidase (penicillin-binding protein) [Micromonospora phaseoli]|uniref:Membrane carboxypeptidase (Penicillin-binding protein) n=1 Tax=Micromonospora phaseoli TaxID=1144548 RepID=A0A1H6WE00_9ACTN|nr:transglycosylase domain-containing protein [Micromonospora phaseoli]PZW01773.1 membrane peptidoglycan carboxypeptidase [Micromonospora phaseoli]SEJ15259.1 Membrane carboxypeptidase (penicillin-binding protein) [Micromonospora phaseoli]